MAQHLDIVVPDEKDPKFMRVQSAGPQFVQQAEAMQVRNDDELVEAEQFVRRLAQAKLAVADLFARPLSDAQEVKRAAERARKSISEAQEVLLLPLERADRILRDKAVVYRLDRDRKAEAEKRERELAARKQAEDEQLERAARLQNLAKATGDDAYAQAAERELNSPVRPVAVVAAVPPPKTTGVYYQDVVGVEVTSLVELCRAIGKGKVDEAAVEPDIAWLKKKAESDGEGFDVPGVRRIVTKAMRTRT